MVLCKLARGHCICRSSAPAGCDIAPDGPVKCTRRLKLVGKMLSMLQEGLMRFHSRQRDPHNACSRPCMAPSSVHLRQPCVTYTIVSGVMHLIARSCYKSQDLSRVPSQEI